jgi:hypothetical protein
MEQAFRDSPWPLYGIPPEVSCGRFLASWGHSEEGTNSLELGHFPSDGSREKQLRIEVRPLDPPWQDTKEDLARGLWRRAHLPVPPVEDLDSLRRLSQEADRTYPVGSDIDWEPTTVVIDRERVTCHKAQLGPYWHAVLRRDDYLVVISGHDWPSDGLELVTITDLEPYLQGSRSVWREGLNV